MSEQEYKWPKKSEIRYWPVLIPTPVLSELKMTITLQRQPLSGFRGYAFITQEDWPWGSKKSFVLKSVQATAHTKVSVLGQNDQVLEYQQGIIPKTEWSQKESGLHITATRAQRIYNDRTWPNPVVLKITRAK